MNEIKCVYNFKVHLFGIIKIQLYVLMLNVALLKYEFNNKQSDLEGNPFNRLIVHLRDYRYKHVDKSF